jgi:phosphoglucan,water dikinase
LIEQLAVPDAVVSEALRLFGEDARLAVRSSANCEDLEELAGAGLYESVVNVTPSEMAAAVRTVWSSLWTTRAVLSRRQAGISHDQAHMAVLVQDLVLPDYSFILHTANPINHDVGEIYTEVVVGLGETLASAATRGSPYRMTCRKNSDAVSIQAFANFSQALRPGPEGGVQAETLNYSHIELSRLPEVLTSLGRKLAAIGRLVETAFGKPQDIEGAVVAGRIFLVQARPQQGLAVGKES